MPLPLPSIALREQVPLAPFTTWRIGGPARYLAEPEAHELPELLAWAKESGLPLYVLGRGSNVLIDDAGLPGLVLLTRNTLQTLDRVGEGLVAGAGVSLPRLSKFAAGEGFTGYEFLIGIPGTVGGAVVMNAGFKADDPRHFASLVESVEFLDFASGKVERLPVARLQARYRHTVLQERPGLVLRVWMRLDRPGDPALIRALTQEHLQERKRKQPLTRPTAGSVFKAVGTTPAAVYIDQAGLKGLQVGDAIVSPKHANWIENLGQATAADVRQLIREVQARVLQQFSVTLEAEIRELPAPSRLF